MAKRRRQSKQRSGSGFLFALLLGLLIGVGAAAAVAWFVTQVPMPFFDKASRDPAQTLLPDVRDAPDPNIGMYDQSKEPADSWEITPPERADSDQSDLSDDISKLLSRLQRDENTSATSPSDSQTIRVPGTEAPAVEKANEAIYFLQAGAFRSQNDADAMKARILLLGMSSHVEKGESGGSTIYRVRVGPFKGIDDMNRSRARLSTEKIETAVVRN